MDEDMETRLSNIETLSQTVSRVAEEITACDWQEDQLMFTVNKLAIQSKAPVHVVRYYARIGLIQPAGKQKNGYRFFTPEDATRIRFIRMAKHLGFTLSEIKRIMQHADMGESPCDDVRKIIQHRIEENRVKIKAMVKLQARMEQALGQWRHMPNGIPDGDSICHLIESVGSDEVNETLHTVG